MYTRNLLWLVSLVSAAPLGEKMRKAPILFHYTNLAEGVTEQRLETDVYVPLA